MLRRLTFGLGIIEAAILIGLLLQYLADPPGDAGSGGPQMALFFFVLLPMLPLAVAFALLVFGRRSRLAGGIAMLIIAFPVLCLGMWGLNELKIILTSAIRRL